MIKNQKIRKSVVKNPLKVEYYNTESTHFLYCNKDYQKKFDESLKKGFVNTYNILNYNINKFILLLRKDVYLYEKIVKNS